MQLAQRLPGQLDRQRNVVARRVIVIIEGEVVINRRQGLFERPATGGDDDAVGIAHRQVIDTANRMAFIQHGLDGGVVILRQRGHQCR